MFCNVNLPSVSDTTPFTTVESFDAISLTDADINGSPLESATTPETVYADIEITENRVIIAKNNFFTIIRTYLSTKLNNHKNTTQKKRQTAIFYRQTLGYREKIGAQMS